MRSVACLMVLSWCGVSFATGGRPRYRDKYVGQRSVLTKRFTAARRWAEAFVHAPRSEAQQVGRSGRTTRIVRLNEASIVTRNKRGGGETLHLFFTDHQASLNQTIYLKQTKPNEFAATLSYGHAEGTRPSRVSTATLTVEPGGSFRTSFVAQGYDRWGTYDPRTGKATVSVGFEDISGSTKTKAVVLPRGLPKSEVVRQLDDLLYSHRDELRP